MMKRISTKVGVQCFVLFFLLSLGRVANGQMNINTSAGTKSKLSSEQLIREGSGTLVYSIPLFNIESGGVSLPISITYTGEGTQVSSTASWVGQNWSLSYGGKISRQLNGTPDDIYIDNTDVFNPDGIEGYLNTEDQFFNMNEYESLLNVTGDYSHRGVYDLRPDVFRVETAMGVFDEFSIKKKNTVLPSDASDIADYDFVSYKKVISDLTFSTLPSRLIKNFKISDRSGRTFVFGEEDDFGAVQKVTIPEFEDLEDIRYNGEWLISKVLNGDGDVLFDFEYGWNQSGEQQEKSYWVWASRSLNGAANDMQSSGMENSSINRLFEEREINTITYDGGSISFIPGLPRQDVAYQQYELAEIQQHDIHGNLLKRYVFHLDYVDNGGFDNLRMYLTSIDEYNSQDVLVETIEFQYNEGQIPKFPTPEVDQWGYYNGLNGDVNMETHFANGIFIRPEYESNATIPKEAIRQFMWNFSDRSPSLNHTRIGSLEKISDTHGRSIEFEYELNEYSHVNHSGDLIGVQQNGQYQTQEFYPNTYTNSSTGVEFYEDNIHVNGVVTHSQWVEVKFTPGDPIGLNTFPCIEDMVIEDYFGEGVDSHSLQLNQLTQELDPNQWTLVYIEAGEDVNFIISPIEHNMINPGVCPVSPSASVQPHISVKYFDEDLSAGGNVKNSGGLRLKKVITDSKSEDRFAKIYDYSLFSDPSSSSGVLVNSPMKIHKSGRVNDDGDLDDIYTLLVTNSTLSNSISNNVVYSNIETKKCPCDQLNQCIENVEVDNITGIKREHFKFAFNENPDVNNYPFLPSMENTSRMILLDKTETLDWNHTLLSSSSYDYSLIDDFSNSDLVEGIQTTAFEYDVNVLFEITPVFFKNFDYELKPEVTRLTNKSKNISVDGRDVETSLLTEYYDDGFYDLISRQVEILDDGNKVVQIFSYSGSLNFDSTTPLGGNAEAIKALQEKGNYREPIESIKYLESADGSRFTILDHVILTYFQDTNGKVNLNNEISRIHESSYPSAPTLKTISPSGEFVVQIQETDDFFQYTRYAEDNFLLEWKDDKDVFNAMIYDSEEKVNTAKVKNSEFDKNRYTSFEYATFKGGWNGIEEDHIQQSNENEKAVTGEFYYSLGEIEGESGQFNSIGNGSMYLPTGKYLLSYWKKGYVTVYYNGSASEISTSTKETDEWTYVEKVFECTSLSNNFITISSGSGEGFIDEVRLHNIDGTMATSGYYIDGKVKYKVDAAGNISNYEYDNKRRPVWKTDENDDVQQYHQYYERDPENSNSYNKHVLVTPRKENMSKQDVLNANEELNHIKKEVVYTDGMGRFRQKIVKYTGENLDEQIEFANYDDYGRQLRHYLPYYKDLGASDDYQLSALADQASFFENQIDENENTDFPYAEKVVENSPLQRTLEQGGIGEELQPDGGHTSKMEYGWNDVNDHILKWIYDESTKQAMVSPSQQYWENGALRKMTSISPDGVVMSTFKDARGREVAKSILAHMYDNQGSKSTGFIAQTSSEIEYEIISYAVFDDFNRPRYEISAKAVEELPWSASNGYVLDYSAPTAVFKESMSFFDYDEKGRIRKRYSPGGQFIEYVYDIHDRLIMTQDALQAEEDKWAFKKYDARGREIINGILEAQNSMTRAQHQTNADGYIDVFEQKKSSSPNVFEYSNVSYPPIDEDDVLNVYYFDDYEFEFPSNFEFEPFEDNLEELNVTRGFSTGSKTRVINSNGAFGDMLSTVIYYDDEMRPIQSFTENHKGGNDRVDTYYNDFYGFLAKTVQHHQYSDNSDVHILKTRYVYDTGSGNLKNTYCQIDDDPEVMVSNRNYDVKGQLKDLKLHRLSGVSNYLQYIDYRYNAQGMLTHINNTALIDDGIHNLQDDDVFGQELTYFKPSPEYNDPGAQGSLTTNNPLANYVFNPQYGGQVSSMMWNAKAPEEDGTTLSRNVYVYEYDDFGNMVAGYYAADSPSMPGEFEENLGYYDEHVNYDLGGNIVKLNRSNLSLRNINGSLMDELTYNYENDGYKLSSVSDAGLTSMSGSYKHFIDGANTAQEYTYDTGGKILTDYNKGVSFQYNDLNLPRRISQLSNASYNMRFIYDAAGNKLQKRIERAPCEPGEPCPIDLEYDIDYVGNFVYEKGEIKMIYHPEGVIRPTPSNADNETEYVYDYFIKDYLGNVRAVVTEEDAVITDKFLATMEEVHAVIEEENFDHINETREPLPTGYPANGSMLLNESIAQLSAANGTEMGPSIVMPVKRGDRVSLSTEYFYEEDAPGTTYDNMGYLVNEILIALATSGAGVLNLSEAQLIDIASGDPTYTQAIMDLLDNSFDDSDIYKPHAYLVWMLYDVNMKLVPGSSGAMQVENPNSLEALIRDVVNVSKDGYLHAYVSNGSSIGTNFDNFLVTRQRGKIRQINDYYPYGLSISGINGDYDEYAYKYQGKELQTGEFDTDLSTGLEMFDFHARYYDPQLGRWFTPDPAEQFSNPYLAMGNNPVSIVDPNGEFGIGTAMLIGAAVSAYMYVGQTFTELGGENNWNVSQFVLQTGSGVAAGAMSYGVGTLFGPASESFAFEGARAIAHGAIQGMVSEAFGGQFRTGFYSSFVGSAVSSGFQAFGDESALGMILFSGVSGGIAAELSGGEFMDGFGSAVFVGAFNHALHTVLPGPGLVSSKEDLLLLDKTRGLYVDPLSGIVYDSSGNYVFKFDSVTLTYLDENGGASLFENYPSSGRISQDYTIEGALFMGIRLLKSITSLFQTDSQYTYDSSLNTKTDKYHNYPQAIENETISHGYPATRIVDRSRMYFLRGTVNGKPGIYELGITPNNVIFHRVFKPL